MRTITGSVNSLDFGGECRTLTVGLTFSRPPPRDSVSMVVDRMRVPRGEGCPMSDITSWQVEAEAAEFYEANLVPALMSPWAVATATAAGVRPGDRVLDVACGTGVATRAASALAGPGSRVVGFDLNHGMLAVARRIRGDLEWRQGDAASMPFPDADYDRVLCQFGLMFMPDRAKALREMRRVLAAGGGFGLAVWGPIETSPPYARQAEIAERLVGDGAAAIVRAPFA